MLHIAFWLNISPTNNSNERSESNFLPLMTERLYQHHPFELDLNGITP